MDNPLGIFCLLVFMLYAVMCMIRMPMLALDTHNAERACAEKYQVFKCERGNWKPVVGTAAKGGV